MPLPPKDDPSRPLHVAVRSSRVIGYVIIAIAWLIGLVLLLGLRIGGVTPAVKAMAVSLVVWGGIGAGYVLLAGSMARRNASAVIGCLVLNSIMLFLFTLGLIGQAYRQVSVGNVHYIQLGIEALIALALNDVEYNLIKSMKFLKQPASLVGGEIDAMAFAAAAARRAYPPPLPGHEEFGDR